MPDSSTLVPAGREDEEEHGMIKQKSYRQEVNDVILRFFDLLFRYLDMSKKLLSTGKPKDFFVWLVGTLLGAIDGILF